MKGMAIIQILDPGGNWRDVTTVINHSAIIVRNMESVARMNKNRQVRAVDDKGNILNISPAILR